MWNFRVIDVSRAFVRSDTLESDAYPQLPRGVEMGTIARKLLKPVYGLVTSGKDWGWMHTKYFSGRMRIGNNFAR